MARETKIISGQHSVGTEGDDQPNGVSLRIDFMLGDQPSQARAMLRSPELVDGLIGQLKTMRDEIWDPKTRPSVKAQGSVDVTFAAGEPVGSQHGITVSGKRVAGFATPDIAGRAASKLRARLASSEPLGTALVSVMQEIAKE